MAGKEKNFLLYVNIPAIFFDTQRKSLKNGRQRHRHYFGREIKEGKSLDGMILNAKCQDVCTKTSCICILPTFLIFIGVQGRNAYQIWGEGEMTNASG